MPGADRRFSPQTLSLLAALETNPTEWRHGYALGKETGVREALRRGAIRMLTFIAAAAVVLWIA